MNPKKISALLHKNQVRQHYRLQPGEEVSVELPHIPLTRQTEFLALTQEIKGDAAHFREATEGEGTLSPRRLQGRALRPGRTDIVLHAVDALSGQEIAEVKPFSIVVEVEESE
jgi:hypothetical protein